MRRFEVRDDAGITGGVGVLFDDGQVARQTPLGKVCHATSLESVEHWVRANYPGSAIRFLDFPPAAKASDGTPVYTVDNPPPKQVERPGRSASSAVSYWSERLAQERGRNWGQPEPEDKWDALMHVLDERLGPAPGKGTP